MVEKGDINKPSEPTINLPNPIGPKGAQPVDPVQPRAIGQAALSVGADNSGRTGGDIGAHTGIKTLRHAGSLKLVFPQGQGHALEAILVNTAGGITGGDAYALDLRVDPGATLTLTTQASERAYRAQSGEVGQVTSTVSVGAGARMNWLPQELILFERSALRRSLSINLAPDAQLLMVEPVVFGRAAMNEALHDIRFEDRITITRDGRPLYVDAMQLHGDAAAQLARPAVANGAGAMASVVYVHPKASAQVSAVRAALPATAGASLIADDVLVIRHLAQDGFELRRALLPVLERLLENTLPASWRL